MLKAIRTVCAAAVVLLMLTSSAAAVPAVDLAHERAHAVLDAAKTAAWGRRAAAVRSSRTTSRCSGTPTSAVVSRTATSGSTTTAARSGSSPTWGRGAPSAPARARRSSTSTTRRSRSGRASSGRARTRPTRTWSCGGSARATCSESASRPAVPAARGSRALRRDESARAGRAELPAHEQACTSSTWSSAPMAGRSRCSRRPSGSSPTRTSAPLRRRVPDRRHHEPGSAGAARRLGDDRRQRSPDPGRQRPGVELVPGAARLLRRALRPQRAGRRRRIDGLRLLLGRRDLEVRHLEPG